MKITKQRLSKKQLWAVTLVVLLVIGVAAYTILKLNQSPVQSDTGINYSPPSEDQVKAGEEAKEGAIDRGSSSDALPAQSSPTPIKMTSTYDSDKKQVIVSSSLENTVSWSKCTLTLTQNSTVKTYEARTVYQADASFCGGFTIPASELANGQWRLLLQVSDLNGKIYEANDDVSIS